MSKRLFKSLILISTIFLLLISSILSKPKAVDAAKKKSPIVNTTMAFRVYNSDSGDAGDVHNDSAYHVGDSAYRPAGDSAYRVQSGVWWEAWVILGHTDSYDTTYHYRAWDYGKGELDYGQFADGIFYCSGWENIFKVPDGDTAHKFVPTEDSLVIRMEDRQGDFDTDTAYYQKTWTSSEIPTGHALQDTIYLQRESSVKIGENEYATSKNFKLFSNKPNPFKHQTNIQYILPEKADVELTVTNIQGEKIATLVNSTQGPGKKKVTWDGNNKNGTEAPAGVYFYNFKAGDYQEKMKMVLTN